MFDEVAISLDKPYFVVLIIDRVYLMSKQHARGRKVLYYLQAMSLQTRRIFQKWVDQNHGTDDVPWKAVVKTFCRKRNLERGRAPSFEELTQLFLPNGVGKTPASQYVGVRLAQLLRIIHNFIAYQALQEHPYFKSYLLLDWHTRQWDDRYTQRFFDLAQKQVGPGSHTQSLQGFLMLETAMNEHLANQAGIPGNNRLQEVERTLDHYLVLQKLKYACANLIEQRLGANHPPSRMMKLILLEFVERDAEYPIVVHAYYHAYLLLGGESPEGYRHPVTFAAFLELWLQICEQQIPEGKDLFTFGQNYCAFRLQKGDPKAGDEIANFYLSALKIGLFRKAGNLSPIFLKNCVEILCRLGMVEKAEEVVLRFGNQLPLEEREYLIRFQSAVICFHRKDFSLVAREMYELIGVISYLPYRIGGRTYLCRSLWEMGEHEYLLETLHAFTQFVYRKKDELGESAKNYRKFIGYLSRMSKVMLGEPDKMGSGMLRIERDLDKKEAVGRFRWLRRKQKGTGTGEDLE